MILKLFTAAAGLAAALTGAVEAQDWMRPASFGGTELRSGFSPDPHVRNLTAGGTIRAASRFSNCNGYIADAPDYSVSYQAGSLPLIFTADSDRDTTLIINDPNGDWWCDDDGAEAPLNPMIRFDQPASGRYDVWVGTYSSGAGVPATLFISELGEFTRESAGGGRITANTGGLIEANTGGLIQANTGTIGSGGAAQAPGLRWNTPPTYQTLSLSAGFSNDPRSISLTAGGTIDAPDHAGCRGNVASAPDVTLTYQAGSFPLYFNVDSDTDTTLVVRGPGGSWFCDDDGAEAPFNPLITLNNPQSGEYDIWVGTFGSEPAPATLYISELGEPNASAGGSGGWSGSGVDISLAPRHGAMSLNGGFLPDPATRRVTAGGSLTASDAVQSGCYGSITREPTVELRYSGSGSLYIYTTGSTDTTLAVNRPDGTWVCNDDGASGTNAGLAFSGSTGGTYDIYVGKFGGGEGSATLNVSELGMQR
ncbi:MAG: hypothetical protein ACFE0P_09485 [Oceanicaulis sp.]